MAFSVPDCYRLRDSGLMSRMGPFDSDDSYGNNGAFRLPPAGGRTWLLCIASDGGDWEHVSVHAIDNGRDRTPSWDEMCRVKDLFWGAEDVVMQLHPRRSEYVNHHPHTLHLWRPVSAAIPEPIPEMVGPRSR